MRITLVLWLCLLLVSGCAREKTEAPVAAPTGRLVPEVVASFEDDTGKWRAISVPEGRPLASKVVNGEASRGDRWLRVDASGSLVVEAPVPAPDWTKFGDMIRADTMVVPPPTGGASVIISITDSRGKTSTSPSLPVPPDGWQTVEWKAGPALADIATLSVAYRIPAGWTGHVGLDNVRVGASTGLRKAYSVVNGPFSSRDSAVQMMKSLKSRNIDSFPFHEKQWYLSLGTFTARPAAEKAADELRSKDLIVTVMER